MEEVAKETKNGWLKSIGFSALGFIIILNNLF